MIFSDTPPADCRSPLAISQGYQLLYNKWYRVGETPVEHSDAKALCEDAGARLAIFDAREDWLAVQNVTGCSQSFQITSHHL